MSIPTQIKATVMGRRDILGFLHSDEVVLPKTLKLTFWVNHEPRDFKVMFFNKQKCEAIGINDYAKSLDAAVVQSYVTQFFLLGNPL